MVILADEVLESFFETDLSASFKLEPVPEDQRAGSGGGLLGDLFSNIVTEDGKNMFNKLADGIGRTMGKHKVSSRQITGLSTFCAYVRIRSTIVHR